MEKVVVDAETREKLRGLSGELALADEAGKTLAYVLPPDLYDQVMTAWIEREPTPEEREAAREEYRKHGGLTTPEAIEYVRTGRLSGEGHS